MGDGALILKKKGGGGNKTKNKPLCTQIHSYDSDLSEYSKVFTTTVSATTIILQEEGFVTSFQDSFASCSFPGLGALWVSCSCKAHPVLMGACSFASLPVTWNWAGLARSSRGRSDGRSCFLVWAVFTSDPTCSCLEAFPQSVLLTLMDFFPVFSLSSWFGS